MELTKGANCPLCSEGSAAQRFSVQLDWQANADMTLDASLFLLAANDQITGDHDLVFYNQPSRQDGVATHQVGKAGEGFREGL